MALSIAVTIIMLSLSAVPITYVVNKAQALNGELGLLISGVACLSLLCLLVYMVLTRQGASRNPFFCVLMLGTFSSVVDFIIGLEADNLLTGFMTNYLRDGEPYLQTPYGTMICYWDGIGHYAMYILMLTAYSWRRSYREIGLYWAGSIGHSMIVFIPGNVVGKYGLRPSFLLNIPYMIIPFWSLNRFLQERPKPTNVQSGRGGRIWTRPLDSLLVLGLITSAVVAFLRGFAALGAPNTVFQIYQEQYEPYLNDPVSYPKIQMLVYMFYYVPYYIMAIHGLVCPGNTWMADWSLVHAGAAAQAQVSHIGGSMHSRTSPELRVPEDPFINATFWVINIGLLLIMPHVLALRCNNDRHFFLPVSENSKQSPKKLCKVK